MIMPASGRPHPAGTPIIQVIVHGDSFVANVGSNPATINVAQRISTQIDNQYGQPNSNTGTTLGYSGDGFVFIDFPGSHNFNFVQDITPFIVPQLSSSLPNWVVNINDCNDCAIGGQTPAQSYAALQTYCAGLIAASPSVPASRIVFSCPNSRNGFADVTRNSFISLLLADSGGIGYKVARNDQEALLCAANAFTNTTYFQPDGIHLTDAGYQLLAQYVAKAMFG